MLVRPGAEPEGARHLPHRSRAEAQEGHGGVLGRHLHHLAGRGVAGHLSHIPQEPAQDVGGVHRLGQEHPPAPRRGPQPGAHADRLGGLQAYRLGQEDVADGPAGEEGVHGLAGGVVDAVVYRVQAFPGPARRRHHGVAVGQGGGHRFLHHHVMPRRQGLGGEPGVNVVGEEHGHDVRLAILQHLRPGAVDTLHAERLGPLPGPRRVLVEDPGDGDGGPFARVGPGDGLQVGPGDGAAAGDGDPDGWWWCRHVWIPPPSGGLLLRGEALLRALVAQDRGPDHHLLYRGPHRQEGDEEDGGRDVLGLQHLRPRLV